MAVEMWSNFLSLATKRAAAFKFSNGKSSATCFVSYCMCHMWRSKSTLFTVSCGLPTLIEFSRRRGDVELREYLNSNPEKVLVHNECRRNYADESRFAQQQKRKHVGDQVPLHLHVEVLPLERKNFLA